MPWSATSAAAAASAVDNGFEAQSTSSAPPAFRGMARFAGSVVTWRHAEVFDGERAEHAAIEHAAAQHVIPAMTRARDGAEQAPSEGVPSTRGVAHRFQWVGRREEHALLREQ